MKNKVLLFCLFFQVSIAQQKTLNSSEFWQIVQQYHPLMKQSVLEIKQADAGLTIARGAFDPILQHYSTQKTADGKNFTNYHTPALSIPTWYGIEFNAGIENILADTKDPSQASSHTRYLGLQIPLAKNVLIDKRRAALQQAKIFQKMARQAQRKVMNDLLLESMENYIDWLTSYRVLQFVEGNFQNASKRLDFVRKSVELGDRPAVDTLEALTQMQSLENLRTAKTLEYAQAQKNLSAYLWNANNQAVDLPDDVIPASNEPIQLLLNADFELLSLLEKAKQNHPEILQNQQKLASLAVDKKLKFQNLLPKIDFSFHVLSQDAASAYYIDDINRYGLKFELPLRLSEGRGSYQTAKLKLENEQLNLNQKQTQIDIKIRNYHKQMTALQKQIRTQESAYANYLALVKAEEMRFENGESSLFLINNREIKSLEAAEKLVGLQAYLQKTTFALQASAGVLYEN